MVNWVGPILQSTILGKTIVEILKSENAELQTTDRGSYIRALAPSRCILSRSRVEEELGDVFIFPQNLELVMSSFQGQMLMTQEKVIWYAGTH